MTLTQISTAGVKDDAVTSGKIPANAVGSSELADNAVDTNAIQSSAVVEGKIASGAITEAKIGTNAVTNSKIAQNSVTAYSIADATISATQLADQAVTLAKLEHGTSSNDGKFLRANNGADPTFETVTGTTINNNADNRVITGSGTANTLNGESTLTYDGTTLGLKANDARITIEDNTSGTVNSAFRIIAFNGTNFIQSGTNLDNDSASTLAFSTINGATEWARFDSSGRFMIGTTTEGHPAGDELTVSNTSGHAGISIRSGTTSRGSVYFSDGTSGADEYRGAVNYDHNENYLRFYTNGSERVRILSGGGITFNGDTATANALHDYEEGTFTAAAASSSSVAFQSSNDLCGYTKIGRQVTVTGQLLLVSSPTGTNVRIGLPFTAANLGDDAGSSVGSVALYDYNTTGGSGGDYVTCLVDTNQAYIRFMEINDNSPWSNIDVDGSAYIRFTVTYFTT